MLELKVAQLAVVRASRLAQAVAAKTKTESITKADDSPVTIADFAAQAVIINAIKHVFPNDRIVGEEDAAKLRADPSLRDKVMRFVDEASDDAFVGEIGRISNADAMMDSLDQGNYEGGPTGRMWALDPIDGTKGYLRKEQYAVCLALIQDSQVILGVIGCPNLQQGTLYSAIKGRGATMSTLSGFDLAKTHQEPIHFRELTEDQLDQATFCESVEAGHSAHSTQAKIAAALGITKPSVRMDSQAKYCSIAAGNGDIYLRLPVSDTYEEKIWDHAAGNVIVSEAGGVVSDRDGQPLDFGQGRTLKHNKGVVACHRSLHARVLAAVRQSR